MDHPQSITPRLAEMLVRQISSEVTAHQQYLGISIYFKRENLDRWAKLFLTQALEEAGHAKKIIEFLIDVNADFNLPGSPGASTHFADAMDACKAALSGEQRVSNEFQAMAEAAIEEKDFRVFEFLQWFIEEQVEEETKMEKVMDLISSGINLFQAEALLDAFE